MDMRECERPIHDFTFYDIMSDIKMASLHEPSNDIRPDHSQEQEEFKGQAGDRYPNGIKEVDTHTVIFCSEHTEEYAKNNLVNKSRCVVCKDKSVFNAKTLPVSSSVTILLVLDPNVHAVIMTRKGLLHKSVNKYFLYVSEQKARLRLVDKCEKREMFLEVFYQLPKTCRKEWSEIVATAGAREQDSEETSESEEEDEEDDEEDDGDDVDDYDEEDEDKISDEEVNEEDHRESTAMETESSETPAASNQAVAREVYTTEVDAGSDAVALMTGTKETMIVDATSETPLRAIQVGVKNTMSLNFVNKNRKQDMRLHITTDDEEIAKALKTNISKNKNSINGKLEAKKAMMVSVLDGSVIIEIEVEPGQEMTSDWIKSVLDIVLSESMRTVVPEGTTLNLDITSNHVVPLNYLTSKQKQQAMEFLNKIGGVTSSSSPRQSAVPVNEFRDMLSSVLEFGVTSKSGPVDITDIEIILLEALSHITEEEPWNHAVKYPKLFRSKGPFYNIVKEDVGIKHNKYFELPTFPGKVFRYNEESAEIELCVEPHMHFRIGPDVDKRVRERLEGKEGKKRKAKPRVQTVSGYGVVDEDVSITQKKSLTGVQEAYTDADSEYEEYYEEPEADSLSDRSIFTGKNSGKTKDTTTTDSGYSDATSDAKSKKGDTSATES